MNLIIYMDPFPEYMFIGYGTKSVNPKLRLFIYVFYFLRQHVHFRHLFQQKNYLF